MLTFLASTALLIAAAPNTPEYYVSNTKELQGDDVKLVREDRPSGELDDGQVIKCRGVKEVGSRIPVRICRTRAEWAEIDMANQEALQERRRNVGQIGADGDIIRSM